MSAILTHVLVCDGCGAQYRTDPPLRLAGEARAMAASEGWHNCVYAKNKGMAPSNDFCPKCVPSETPARRPLRPALLEADEAAYVGAILRAVLEEFNMPCSDIGAAVLAKLDPKWSRI